MRPVIFLGPTLAVEEARAELDATFLPPVSQGDLYRVACSRPPAIGIVDGYFHGVPAVWHKEILWAMEQGIHVFGSASMGALRAAELWSFGMEGVGFIFEQYLSGCLEDDDEVAVIHQTDQGSPSLGALSDAMVNIRLTLEAGALAGVISPHAHAKLTGIAKSLFYAHRTYPNVLRLAAEAGVPSLELDRLTAWLPNGRVDQKKRDALSMLRQISARIDEGISPKVIDYHFARTELFDEAISDFAKLSNIGAPNPALTHEILDEIRLEGHLTSLRAAAVGRALVIGAGRREMGGLDEKEISRAIDEFRIEHGLLSPNDIERWADENELTTDQLIGMLHDEAVVRWAADSVGRDVDGYVLDLLRISGRYAVLRTRARAKLEGLEASSQSEDDVSLLWQQDELVEWFLGQRENSRGGIEVLAKQFGFDGEIEFLRALSRERSYLAAQQHGQPPAATKSKSALEHRRE